MRRNIRTVLVSILVVFALIGQGLAYAAMTCDMTTKLETNSSMHVHEGMDHSEHQGHAKMDPKVNCESDCMCPQGTCSATSFLSSHTFTQLFYTSLDKVAFFPPHFAAVNTASPYRPPIFA